MRRFASTPPVEERVGDALRVADQTVAVAESSTGGLIGALLASVPGSSAYFDRAVVPYSYDTKRTMLAVSRETLDEHGAVSAEVAGEMARRVRDLGDATWGLAETGVAGPDGGTEDKPAGTAFVAVAYAAPWETGGSYTRVDRFEFDGTRNEVRERIARQALEDLLGAVEGQE